MNKVVIVDCIRTPMARSKGGAYRNVRAETLSAHLMSSLLKRAPSINPEEIEDIYWGCVQQTLEQGFNIARNAALLANLPKTIAAVTVNRLCGSSMQALHDASRAIATGDANICIVGGVEHMGHIPMTHGIDFHPQLTKTTAKASGMMGLTAEMLAKQYDIPREEQDLFAARSHQRAALATQNNLFSQEIIPTLGHNKEGGLFLLEEDEVIRKETTVEKLAALPPVFDPINGTITAGSSSAISDGASAMLIMSEKKAQELDIPIKAYIKSMAVSGCDPATMGYGPIPATRKALQRANMDINDIDIFEFNEAFAAQALTCIKELGINDIENTVNLNGGAIALGHPLGCSGTRISTTLIHLMESQQCRYGLATMCIGLGQGIATIFERPSS
ncbi:acetyl-CoA C-acyltransferase FadA [Vibrio sp.]|nr:acetyl-CoA C-acyltransferase FadA [Vibrio sp.]